MMFDIYQILSLGGIWLLFLLVLLEGNPIIGSFIPGQVIVIIAGVFMATSGEYSFIFASLIIALGAFLGDLIGFLMGKKLGVKGLKKCKIHPKSKIITSTSAFFDKMGPISIILGRQFNLTRAFVPFVAGISSMKTSNFLLISAISALLWSSISLYLGFSFGYIIIEKITFVVTFITFLIIYYFILYFIYQKIKKITVVERTKARKIMLLNILFSILLIFFIIITILVKEFGFDLWLNQQFAFLIFPQLEQFAFLFSSSFIFILYELLFLINIFKKNIKMVLFMLWSSFLYFQMMFLIAFILKKAFKIHLYLSVFIYVFFFFLIYMMLLEYREKKNCSFTFLRNSSIALFVLLLILLIIKITMLNGSFYEVFLTFLLASLLSEFLQAFLRIKFLKGILESPVKSHFLSK
jgi:membrane-associated protein